MAQADKAQDVHAAFSNAGASATGNKLPRFKLGLDGSMVQIVAAENTDAPKVQRAVPVVVAVDRDMGIGLFG